MLVGQSYGSVIIGEFLAIHGKEKAVVVVIIDSAVERTPMPSDWPTFMGDAMYQAIVGLEANHCLNNEECDDME